MFNYLKLFRDKDEYDETCKKPIFSHLINEVIFIFDNGFDNCSEDGCPPEGCCDLDGGYFS